jgi:hypothetical protein
VHRTIDLHLHCFRRFVIGVCHGRVIGRENVELLGNTS